MNVKKTSRNNSFHFARFAAASIVLYSHHFPLSGNEEPRVPGLGITVGGLAVSVFFCMSGYLIYQSLQRSNNLWAFFSARATRLIPNLVFAMVTTSALMLFWFNNATNIDQHVRYAMFNSTVYAHPVLYTIPGVLEGRPNQSVNGSLWTLQYELFMYLVLFAIFLLKRRLVPIAVALGAVTFWAIAQSAPTNMSFQVLTFNLIQSRIGVLGLMFLSGSLLAAGWPYLARFRWKLSLAAVGLAVATGSTLGQANPMFSLSLGALVILFCTSSFCAWFERYGDASYGIYIFAFPIQQLSIIVVDGFWQSMALAFVLTTAVGYSTWHTFESRAVGWRHGLARLLASPFRGSPTVKRTPSPPAPADSTYVKS